MYVVAWAMVTPTLTQKRPLRLVEMSTPMVLERQLLAVNAEAVKDYAPKKHDRAIRSTLYYV